MPLAAALLGAAVVKASLCCADAGAVRRNVPYGDSPRNFLDLYLPDSAPPGGAPVVVFLTGGMWIIGYKAWGALLARRLRDAGCLVVALDYRNFPQGCVTAMVEDVTAGVAHTLRRARDWGGDPARVTLVGQSAGAHLGALALLNQAQRCVVHGAG